MSRLRLLLRSTAVRLSAVYIVLFALCAGFLVIYVTATSERLIVNEIRETLTQEAGEIALVYGRGGTSALVRNLERRARRPGANLYLIAGPNGEILAGNVASVAPGALDQTGWSDGPLRYELFSEAEKGGQHHAAAFVFQLDNGLRILVGRDLGQPQALRIMVRRAVMAALGIMGIGALVLWFAIGRTALKRIDKLSVASTKIMAGDLSQRLPVSGSGDEYDRLSVSLNDMLGRIEKLNEGLRQVSDNIAHDLKTPLTRLRNKAADALEASDGEDKRQALEGIIAESDQLIRTFNALLMISRVEAGSMAAMMSTVDLSTIAGDCAELYEPSAEEAGLTLKSFITPGLMTAGNRELIGQALANLIDNAMKYGTVDGAPGTIEVKLERAGDMLALSVGDRGPGIPEEQREEAVKRFVRLDQSRSRPGTGLGLSLVEAVMDLHGGRLALSDTAPDEQPRGLTVTMFFPVA